MTDNQTDLKKMADTMVALSAQSNSSQETVKSIQAGTMKLVSESEIAKQNIVSIEKRIDGGFSSYLYHTPKTEVNVKKP